MSRKSALAQMSVSTSGEKGDNVLISLFLRGGMDGLNTVVPYAEDAYHRQRVNLGLGAPNNKKYGTNERVLDLDGFFGFNPALAPLVPLFHDGSLAVVHAAGSGDQTRSHFEAMNAMERGLNQVQASVSSGWLARHLSTNAPAQPSPLRAVAFASTMPDSLRGATGAIALESLNDFRLAADEEANVRAALGDLYAGGKDVMSQAGRDTLKVLETLNRLDPKNYKPSHGADYPKTDMGRGFEQVAFLIRSGVGLEVACLDHGGWDTHVAQGVATGLLSSNLTDIAGSLAAFSRDLGPEMSRVTVVVQTEFGRRLRENSSLGTDHGRASAMFVLGGGVKGGKVYTKWPGLEEHQLEPPGDLRVTTDYRDVLSEVPARRVKGADLAKVFPDYAPRPVGVMA